MVYLSAMEPVMIQLTPEQSKALHLQPQPLIFDPTTQKTMSP